MRAEGRLPGWQRAGGAGGPAAVGWPPEAESGTAEDADEGPSRWQSLRSCCSAGSGGGCRSLLGPWLRHQGPVSGLQPLGEGSSSERWGRALGSGFCVLKELLLILPSVSRRQPLSLRRRGGVGQPGRWRPARTTGMRRDELGKE